MTDAASPDRQPEPADASTDDAGELELDAPWLTETDGWGIVEVPAAALRADVFIYSERSHAFRRVVRVSITAAGGQRMVYCDLTDGRTLRFEPDASVVARRRW